MRSQSLDLPGMKSRMRFALGAALRRLLVAFVPFSLVQALRQALAQRNRQYDTAQTLIEHLIQRNVMLEQRVAQLRQKEAQSRVLAYHDPLTGLSNRTLLQDRFGQTMAQAMRYQKLVAILMIDLDAFKTVNDQLGHPIGDKLLCAVAGRLVESIRATDTASRLGGDEFVIMLPEIEHATVALTTAEKIRDHLCIPHFIDGYEIRMTASIGTALFPFDGATYDELIKHADAAMYRAKPKHSLAGINLLTDAFPIHAVDMMTTATGERLGTNRDATSLDSLRRVASDR
ncbi:MAG: GGDEF domain-containing protein [Betaproteobacteria bacterium]